MPDDLTVPDQRHIVHEKIAERGVHCPFNDDWDIHLHGDETEIRSVARATMAPYRRLLKHWQHQFSPMPELAIHPQPPLFSDQITASRDLAISLIEKDPAARAFCAEKAAETTAATPSDHTHALIQAATVAVALGANLKQPNTDQAISGHDYDV
ncbi:hypothetical protein [Aliidiomarina indica]|uniref:hypothetical protein n=1 Tax=Aliidiomarina indica TaxID=2749147 RepID=UPI0018909EA4|nr:hypothetical protein [Aliidiomarina indica]